MVIKAADTGLVEAVVLVPKGAVDLEVSLANDDNPSS